MKNNDLLEELGDPASFECTDEVMTRCTFIRVMFARVFQDLAIYVLIMPGVQRSGQKTIKPINTMEKFLVKKISVEQDGVKKSYLKIDENDADTHSYVSSPFEATQHEHYGDCVKFVNEHTGVENQMFQIEKVNV